MHFLSMMINYHLERCKERLKISKKPPKQVNTRRNQTTHAECLEPDKFGQKL